MAVPIRKGGSKAVGSGGTTLTVTFAADDEYATAAAFPTGYTVNVPMPVPDWATSVYVSTAPTITAVVFTFGTGAPAPYGGTVYWEAQGYKLA